MICLCRCLLLFTVNCCYSVYLDSNELDILRNHYIPMLNSYSDHLNGLINKRQGIIPGPRVGRSSNSNNNLADLLAHKLTQMHDESILSTLNSQKHFDRIKRSIGDDNDADDEPVNGDAIKSLSMNSYQRNRRQLIPAPRVGRSKPIENNGLILGVDKVLTANLFNGEEDMESDADRSSYRLLAIPRAFFGKNSKDLLKRVALTPRIGRSESLSEGNEKMSDFDDADYFARISKAPLTPRIGRSVGKLQKMAKNTSSK